MVMIKKIRQKVQRYWQRATAQKGYCPICEDTVHFVKRGAWLRDQYKCSKCQSIPRFRALIDALKRFYPGWENMHIHESSPGTGSSSKFLRTRCRNYSSSQYFPDVPRGTFKDGSRSEDLTALTFEDNSFDLVVTQDVFEHVMEPAKAFREIARVLKPGGAHLFSMPWYPELPHTRQRAKTENGSIVHLEQPVYHGNPVDQENGSLVTYDWGQDFVDFIYNVSGMYTVIYLQRDNTKGLDGEFLEIFISRKVN